MTTEQYGAIYGALFDLMVEAKSRLALAKYDFERPYPQRLLADAEAADKALHEAWNSTAILRGEAPCPECGEYLDTATGIQIVEAG
ncbi:MAG TPA: hypothetical protein VH369_22310 [Bryobacteraceae bacterium]|jgi:hypothetical protein